MHRVDSVHSISNWQPNVPLFLLQLEIRILRKEKTEPELAPVFGGRRMLPRDIMVGAGNLGLANACGRRVLALACVAVRVTKNLRLGQPDRH